MSPIQDNAEIRFPEGLPGFGESESFVLIYSDEYAPVYFLQSVTEAEVSLPVLPVQTVDADYRLILSTGDRELLGIEDEPRLGENVVCLVVLVLSGGDKPSNCNLMAPIVMNPRTLLAKQVLQIESDYPSVFPLRSD